MNYSLQQIDPENIKYAVTVLLKVFSFFKKTLGAKQAKKKLSLVYQECLKPNPNKKLITKTLLEFEGVKKFKFDVDEIKQISKTFAASPKGFGFIEMPGKKGKEGKKAERFASSKMGYPKKKKQSLNKNISGIPSRKKNPPKKSQRKRINFRTP